MKISERVDAAADRIIDPEKWTAGFFENDGRMCLVGALRAEFGGSPTHAPVRNFGDYQQTCRVMRRLAEKRFPELACEFTMPESHISTLARLNDEFGHANVIALLKDTAAMLRRWGF